MHRLAIACALSASLCLGLLLAPAALGQTLSFADYTGSHSADAKGTLNTFNGPASLIQPPAGGSGSSLPLESIGAVSAGDIICANALASAERGAITTTPFDWDFTFTYEASADSTNPLDELDPCWPGFSSTASVMGGLFTATLVIPAGTTSWNVKYGIAETIVDATGTYRLLIQDSMGGTLVDQTGATAGGILFVDDLVSLDVTPPAGGETYTLSFSGDAFAHATPASGAAVSEGAMRLVLDIAVCGDGALDPGEQCDDGNTLDGDCCSATCTYQAAPGVGGDPNCCLDGSCQLGVGCGSICFASGAICKQPGGPGTTCGCELP